MPNQVRAVVLREIRASRSQPLKRMYEVYNKPGYALRMAEADIRYHDAPDGDKNKVSSHNMLASLATTDTNLVWQTDH